MKYPEVKKHEIGTHNHRSECLHRKPCIRGLRFPVSRLLGLLASGETKENILKAYPYLEAEDIDEALLYAAVLAEDETVEFAS